MMKKLLGLVLALALVVPASADILKNVKSYGEIQVIGTMGDNMIANATDGQASHTSLRVLYGLNFALTQDVEANVTMAYYNLWGQNTSAMMNPSPSHTGRSLQDYLNDINVVEANVVLKNLFCCLEAKIGRQFYGDEDSAIIYFGPNHYNVEQRDLRQATALDAAVISYAGEALSWNFIYSKVDEIAPFDEDADASLLGFDGKYALNDSTKLQGYFYQFRGANDMTVAQPALLPAFVDKYIGIYGAKVSLGLESAIFSAEYARNVGGEKAFDTDKGNMLKVDAALNLGALTPRATIVRGDGFTSFGNYRPGIIFGQTFGNDVIFLDSFIGNVGVDMSFASMDKFTFTLDGFIFNERNLKGEASYEADAWVKYAMNKNVELHAAVGMFHEHEVDNAYKGQLGMLVRF